jgi:hypothetical protein
MILEYGSPLNLPLSILLKTAVSFLKGKCRSEQNQGRCVLAGFAEGRRFLMVAPT